MRKLIEIIVINNKSMLVSIERKFNKIARQISQNPKLNITNGRFLIRIDIFKHHNVFFVICRSLDSV